MTQSTSASDGGKDLADAADRVIAAAENWASAVEAIAQMRESRSGDAAPVDDALQQARIALYDAVMAWRALRRPPGFTGQRAPKARRRSKVVELLTRQSKRKPPA
jgi:hypothetical protein